QRSISLPPNRSSELGSFALDSRIPMILGLTLSQNETILARAVYWPGRAKDHNYLDPGLHIVRRDSDTLQISVDRPARGVYLRAVGKNVVWNDNMLDLLPGNPQEITAPGAGDMEIQAQWLGLPIPRPLT